MPNEYDQLRDDFVALGNAFAALYSQAINGVVCDPFPEDGDRVCKPCSEAWGAGSPRKMGDLMEALNLYHRIEGREKLKALVDQGVIDGFTPCPPECQMRQGGLFHAAGCENDGNHPVYRERTRLAREKLPGGQDGHDGWRAANVTLVGESEGVRDYYHRKNVEGIARGLK